MNKVIDKGFRSCRFVSTIVKHPVHCFCWKNASLQSLFRLARGETQPLLRNHKFAVQCQRIQLLVSCGTDNLKLLLPVLLSPHSFVQLLSILAQYLFICMTAASGICSWANSASTSWCYCFCWQDVNQICSTILMCPSGSHNVSMVSVKFSVNSVVSLAFYFQFHNCGCAVI